MLSSPMRPLNPLGAASPAGTFLPVKGSGISQHLRSRLSVHVGREASCTPRSIASAVRLDRQNVLLSAYCASTCLHRPACSPLVPSDPLPWRNGTWTSPMGCLEPSLGVFGLRANPRWLTSGLKMFSSLSGGGQQKDLYRILGASPGDGPRAIRAAYLRKAKELHPDANARCPSRHQKEKLFREVTEAYEVLTNPEKRQEYDSQRPKEESAGSPRRHTTDDWHVGRDELGEEFWRQVEQIRKEKEMAWRTMKNQRRQASSRDGNATSGADSPPQMSAAFALLRALPLLVVPVVLFFGLYKSAM